MTNPSKDEVADFRVRVSKRGDYGAHSSGDRRGVTETHAPGYVDFQEGAFRLHEKATAGARRGPAYLPARQREESR